MPEEQKLNEKTSFNVPPPQLNNELFPGFEELNLNNLVVRNENNQSLFSKLSFKMDFSTMSQTISLPFSTFNQPTPVYSEEYDKKRVKMASEMAKDQLGCRLLQKWLDLKNPDIIKDVFNNVIEQFAILMKDPFGNYLCQKIMEISTKDNIKKIIEVIYRDFMGIAMNQHGTRALQKLLENLKDDGNYKRMILMIEEYLLELIYDNNGNHVVQKCLQTLNCEQKQFIYEACVHNVVNISNHKHGLFLLLFF